MSMLRARFLLVVVLLYAAPASAQFWLLSHRYSNGLRGPAHAVESRNGSGQVTEADAYAQAREECMTYPEVVAVSIAPGGGQEKVVSCEELGKDPSPHDVKPPTASATDSAIAPPTATGSQMPVQPTVQPSPDDLRRNPQQAPAAPTAVSQTGKLETASADILPITLPLYRGLPISHVWYSLETNSLDPMNMQQANIQRWLMLMHVAKQPKLLENNAAAAMVAAANLPSAQWPQYLFCGNTASHCDSLVKSLNNQPVIGAGSTRILKAWKGKNQQEQDDSHIAFVERYGKLLVSQASTLPQDMYVVATGSLDPILADTGGIPIKGWQFLNPAGSGKEPNRISTLPLAGNYSALVPNRLPETLPCSASRCTEILDATRIQGSSHQTYPVYLLAKVRLTSVQGTGFLPSNESQATVLGDIEVYVDKELTKKLLQFDSLAQRSVSIPVSTEKAGPEKPSAVGMGDDFAAVYSQAQKGGPWEKQSGANAPSDPRSPTYHLGFIFRGCKAGWPRGHIPIAIKLVSNSGKEAVVPCAGTSMQEFERNLLNAIQAIK